MPTEFKWTFVIDGDQICDTDYDTELAAHTAAEEAFENQCDDEGERGSHDQDIEIIEFEWIEPAPNEDMVRDIKTRKPAKVYWEYSRSDYDEHSTWHSGPGGVL